VVDLDASEVAHGRTGARYAPSAVVAMACS
jgi:hypothetical protein